jgi:hypothetical protein
VVAGVRGRGRGSGGVCVCVCVCVFVCVCYYCAMRPLEAGHGCERNKSVVPPCYP